MSGKKKTGSRLPSGNYRIRAYDYTDDDGKKHYKSFSGRTKAEASAKIAEWKEEKRSAVKAVTVMQACEDYIILKEGMLSPTTVKAYRAYVNTLSEYPLAKADIRDLSNMNMQRFISALAARLSPKTVRNIYGFVTAAIKVYMPDFRTNVTMPQRIKPGLYTPCQEDVQAILDCADTTELKLAILFAAVGTMRRSEACAVTFADVDFSRGTVAVNKSMVQDVDKRWITKPPKTYESNRVIKFPDYIIDMIASLDRRSGTVLNMDPNQLYKLFKKVVRKAGVPDFRFHDLRHFAASNMHAAGVPERYIEAIGGWQPGSSVLKRVYENVLDSELIRIEDIMKKQRGFSV